MCGRSGDVRSTAENSDEISGVAPGWLRARWGRGAGAGSANREPRRPKRGKYLGDGRSYVHEEARLQGLWPRLVRDNRFGFYPGCCEVRCGVRRAGGGHIVWTRLNIKRGLEVALTNRTLNPAFASFQTIAIDVPGRGSLQRTSKSFGV